MALTLDDLFTSPDHYLHSFEGDDALFVPMDRAAYHRSIFLDGRIAPAAEGSMRLPIATLARGVRPPAPTGWIFHVAHCGSTLLARALDRVAGNLVLREPLALRQLAIRPDAARLRIVAAMLGKGYRTDARTIVKANVPVNFLLPDLLAATPGARAIFLHCSLRDYLLAILRDDDHRGWLRRVTGQLAAYLGDTSRLNDAELAAALWLAQMRAFTAALDEMPHGRTLDAETFFNQPREMVTAAARHLDVALSDAEIAEIVAGPLFATYSKNPDVAFDNAARLSRRAALEATLAGELAQAQAWIERTTGESSPGAARIRAAALS